jgi:AAA family ATPase
MVFTNVSLKGPKRSFVVDSINGGSSSLGRFDETSTVSIAKLGQVASQSTSSCPRERLKIIDIAGIDQALQKLNRFLSNFNREFKYTWSQRSCAVLLHGGHGTGKTYILNKIIKSGWGKVYKIGHDAKASSIRTVFRDAKLSQPSIIVLDDLEAIVSKDDTLSHNITKELGEELDNLMENHPPTSLPQVLVIAATREPTSIPMSLKKRGRFTTDVALPVPDAAARRKILKSLQPPLPPDTKDETLDKLGDRTHAYTAEDLVSLLDASCEIAEERSDTVNGDASEEEHFLTQEDIEQALLLVRPTAMHDITLQPPSVRWNQIGGQDSVKKALRRAVETPLLVCYAPVPQLSY